MAQATGRIRISLKDEPREPETQCEESPRIVRLLALAHRWHRLIDEGNVKDQAEIARLMGLTPARVAQIMALRWLSPAVQEWLVGGQGPVGTEKEWRVMAADARWLGRTDSIGEPGTASISQSVGPGVSPEYSS